MERILIIVVIAGAVLVFFGVQETIVSAGTTQKPQPVELADLENNAKVTNNNAALNDFWALYPNAIYQYTKSKYSNDEPTDATSIDFSYFPIISDEHPYFDRLNEVAEKYGAVEEIPDEEWPEVGDFSVLVKSKRFATVGDIPYDHEFVTDGISGLFINRIKTLSGEEKKLLLESFPSLSVDKVLILEEGRRPSSQFINYGMIVLGVAIIAVPLIVIIRKKLAENKQADAASVPPEPQDPVA